MAEAIVHEQWDDFVDLCPGISVSRQPQETGGVLRPHWHERVEIWRVLEGRMDIACEREAFHGQKGDIIVFNSFEVHSCMAPSRSMIDCYILDLNQMAGGADGEIKQTMSQILCGSIRFCHLIRNQSDLWALLDMASELLTRQEDNSAVTLSLYGLFYLIFGKLCAEHVFVRDEHRHQKKTDDMSVILNYIYSNYHRRLTLDDLASCLCFSKSYFCRWFKAKIGESPIDYLNTVRVRRAYELLCSTGLSVTEICYQTGFADINCFNRQFKSRMSVSPSGIRRRRAK